MSDGSTDRLKGVRRRIDEAAGRSGRSGGEVTLVAVSKTFAADEIVPVIAAGQREFGENRVQEAQAKWPRLKAGQAGIVLHLIGPLQSNKAADAVALFDVIETVDRPKIARAIASEMRAQDRSVKLFVQVNTGEETQKAGVLPGELAELLQVCRHELGLSIAGLMCIPPVDEEPAVHFALLSKLASEHEVAELSMGMSGDYETAVEFGATSVRVGSAIFGARS